MIPLRMWHSLHPLGASQVKHVVSYQPTVELDEIPELETSWTRTSNVTVSNFSATCFLTGSTLQSHLGYPVGLVDSSWAGAFRLSSPQIALS